MKKTLLLVFIHGFKGDDKTFHNFPKDLRGLLSHTLPKVDIVSVQYPKYETRGDLKECVSKFKEWLQNQVIDLEVANGTPSPTVDPSVHVILCGHSMGGIVAAETLLSIVNDQPIPASNIASNVVGAGQNATISNSATSSIHEPSHLYFPFVRAVLAFDTPYLGISPGVLAHGAEEQYNHASTAFKAFDTASSIFGWNNSAQRGAEAAAPAAAGVAAGAATAANASGRSSPGSTGWGKWGRYAMVGGAAAAAVAGVAGAAYMNRKQITEGLAWAGSHLEFVGCLARGAELKERMETVVGLTDTHEIGFADFYTALGEKVTSKTKYAGSMVGEERTFCIVPNEAGSARSKKASSSGKTSTGAQSAPENARPRGKESSEEQQMEEAEEVREYAKDSTRSKGRWIRCVNDYVTDEISAHKSMFAPDRNPDYHSMVPRARDQIHEWVDKAWYESSVGATEQKDEEQPSLI